MEFFNSKQYLLNYPEIKGKINPKNHFYNFGLKEKRTDNNLNFHSFNPEKQKIILFTNARDENNMKEWCAHHLLLGFDCIYIFDHLSEKSLESELYNFDSRICVFNINPIIKNFKMSIIDHAVKMAKSVDAEWMLYLDADEFLILNKHSNVNDFLNDYSSFDLISINWLMFGTNGHKIQPNGLLISNFTKCDIKLNQHVKSFVKPHKVQKIFTPHTFILTSNGLACDVNKNKINIFPGIENNKSFKEINAYIAHYHYQSEEKYISRKTNRLNDMGGITKFDTSLNTTHNEIDNFDIKNKYSEAINNFIN